MYKQWVWLGFLLGLSLSACVVEAPAPLPRRDLAELAIDATMDAWEDRYGSIPEQCDMERPRIQLVEFDRPGMEAWCKHEGAVGCFRTTERHWPTIGWARVGQIDEDFSDVITHEAVHWLISCAGMDAAGDVEHGMEPWALSAI
jgi:hypothetical protein